MINLGIAIKKNEIWYSVITGSNMEDSILIETGRQSLQMDTSTGILMRDFYNLFTELITKYSPGTVIYKLSLDVTLKQIPYMHFSLGILNLLCNQNNIAITERSNQWINAGKKSKVERCKKYFSDKSFKTNEEMQATLIAWFEMGQ